MSYIGVYNKGMTNEIFMPSKEDAMKEERHDNAFDYPELEKMSADEFYRTYKGFMYAVAMKEKVDHGQAETAIDDVLETIFMKRACYYDAKTGKFSNYLATMVRNACRNLKRKGRRYVHYEESDMVRICEENGAVSRDKTHDVDDIRRWISAGIKTLRMEVRSQLMVDAFVMSFIDGERPKDVAITLNVRPDYVSLAKNHCLPRLRTIIRKMMNIDN